MTDCKETTNIFGSKGGEELAKRWNLPFVGRIPIEPVICLAGEQGTNPYQQEPSARALEAVTRFVAEYAATHK